MIDVLFGERLGVLSLPCLPSQSAKSLVGLAIAETLTYCRCSPSALACDPLYGRLRCLDSFSARPYHTTAPFEWRLPTNEDLTDAANASCCDANHAGRS